ncbi:unnamed protein product [Dovyalis caffra]|uniref:Uncharacterized protein n=1 Tax=Dovyalis caffra TaxID=77055 RepID=A0AAV1R6K5_9ROSI|nr:unnamed protein product [Dovyalis caffra]
MERLWFIYDGWIGVEKETTFLPIVSLTKDDPDDQPTAFAGFTPKGTLPEILEGAGLNPGLRGGLEIVFNQQLTRLG